MTKPRGSGPSRVRQLVRDIKLERWVEYPRRGPQLGQAVRSHQEGKLGLEL